MCDCDTNTVDCASFLVTPVGSIPGGRARGGWQMRRKAGEARGFKVPGGRRCGQIRNRETEESAQNIAGEKAKEKQNQTGRERDREREKEREAERRELT